MAVEIEPNSIIDPDKQNHIDYLFNTNPLPINYLHNNHRKLQNDDAPPPNNQNPNKKFKVNEILHNIQNKNNPESESNPQQILHNKNQKHHVEHSIHSRQNYIHTHTAENARIESRSFLLVLFTVIFLQILIWYWRKHHIKSFFMVTLLGLWLFPIVMSIQLHY
eukprot:885468_1